METSQWEWGLHLCLKAKEYDIISSKGLSSCSTGHLRGLTDKSYWFGGPIAFRTSPVEESNSCKGEFSILTPDLEKQQFQALELTAHRVFSILILIMIEDFCSYLICVPVIKYPDPKANKTNVSKLRTTYEKEHSGFMVIGLDYVIYDNFLKFNWFIWNFHNFIFSYNLE